MAMILPYAFQWFVVCFNEYLFAKDIVVEPLQGPTGSEKLSLNFAVSGFYITE